MMSLQAMWGRDLGLSRGLITSLVVVLMSVGPAVTSAAVYSPERLDLRASDTTNPDELMSEDGYALVQVIRVPEAGLKLRDLILIMYDRMLERPDNPRDPYWERANRTWRELRKVVCPHLLHTCWLPEQMNSPETFEEIAEAMVRPQVLNELREFFAQKGVFFNTLYNPFFATTPFNFIMSVEREVREKKPVQIWDMEGEVVQRDYNKVFVMDLLSYALGFDGKVNPAHFGLGPNGDLLVNEGMIQGFAKDFAKYWHSRVKLLRGRADRQLDPVLDSDDLLALELYEELSADFARLEESEVAEGGVHSEKTFFKVTVEQYSMLVQAQGRYVALAKSQRQGVGESFQYLESLLYLSTLPQARFMAFSLSASLVTPVVGLFKSEQTMPIIYRYMYELAVAVVEMEATPESMQMFSRYRHFFDGQLTTELDFLSREAPEAIDYLAKELGNDFDKYVEHGDRPRLRIDQLSDKQARQVLRYLLFEPSGEMSFVGLNHIGKSIVTRATAAELKDLADHVHKVRSDYFAK